MVAVGPGTKCYSDKMLLRKCYSNTLGEQELRERIQELEQMVRDGLTEENALSVKVGNITTDPPDTATHTGHG